MKKVLVLVATLAAAAFVSCGTGSARDVAPGVGRPEYKYISAASSSSDYCDYCNTQVYSGHHCGRTTPCKLCKREHGAGHLHEVGRVCSPCGWTQKEVHICNDSKDCDACRDDSRGPRKGGPTGEKPCERCYRSLPIHTVVGITTYCGKCNYEVGPNHICGKTHMCLTCVREIGEGHVHDATRLCTECRKEVSLDHQHGNTTYCRECRRDAGPEHVHGRTVWCHRCSAEKEWPHYWHSDE